MGPNRFARIWIGAVLASLGVAASPPAELEQGPHGVLLVEVAGLPSSTGQVRCGLFTRSGWLDDVMRSVAGVVDDHRALCRFESVPDGEYGVAVHHDADDRAVDHACSCGPRAS